MHATETWVRDAAGLDALLDGIAEDLARDLRPDRPLRLIGVRTRGVPIARRLARRLADATGADVPVGAVDITLYRDDLDNRVSWPVLRGTDIPFALDGADVVLVDDVLYTGRTVRAALNALCDLGRPARVRLAVVVDRGGRELPFRADAVGLAVAAGPDERVLVRLQPGDPVEGVVRLGSAPVPGRLPDTERNAR
jgi:pyrimidine operon attenuation protein/uracil phosphoribosyltransferase